MMIGVRCSKLTISFSSSGCVPSLAIPPAWSIKYANGPHSKIMRSLPWGYFAPPTLRNTPCPLLSTWCASATMHPA